VTQVETKSLNTLSIDWENFYNRWAKARISAIRKVIDSDLELPIPEETEKGLLLQLFEFVDDCTEAQSDKMKTLLYRNIFDFSRALGLGLSKKFGVAFELAEFREILSKSTIPCVQGTWESRESAEVLTRKGCDYCTPIGSFACDYWREAIDGLVMGLGESERFVRHASLRHGDSQCVDVFFLESNKRSKASHAWGKIPEHIAPIMTSLCKEFENEFKVSIIVKGMKEGVLYYELKDPTDFECGQGSNLIKNSKGLPWASIKGSNSTRGFGG
jgi:hypothetical protein